MRSSHSDERISECSPISAPAQLPVRSAASMARTACCWQMERARRSAAQAGSHPTLPRGWRSAGVSISSSLCSPRSRGAVAAVFVRVEVVVAHRFPSFQIMYSSPPVPAAISSHTQPSPLTTTPRGGLRCGCRCRPRCRLWRRCGWRWCGSHGGTSRRHTPVALAPAGSRAALGTTGLVGHARDFAGEWARLHPVR